MLNFVTINWKNYEGRGVEYTNILYDSVRRNLEAGVGGRFIVFTDDINDQYNDGIEVRALPSGLVGWFNKLYLFKGDLFPDGDRIIFADLDTLITGAIDRSRGIRRRLCNSAGSSIVRTDCSPLSWRGARGAKSEIWRTFRSGRVPGWTTLVAIRRG